ncbi:hypothetical protein MAR_004117 [Mya arenaria]|uniref:ATP synthase F0 subunit 8 n=1 Tax=Mya arenaria TaxID=6604 RepID=A0ABY7EXK8_MYAAR|nr:hypothetical protein MAR_004117 [Mya arenaria]
MSAVSVPIVSTMFSVPVVFSLTGFLFLNLLFVFFLFHKFLLKSAEDDEDDTSGAPPFSVSRFGDFSSCLGDRGLCLRDVSPSLSELSLLLSSLDEPFFRLVHYCRKSCWQAHPTVSYVYDLDSLLKEMSEIDW